VNRPYVYRGREIPGIYQRCTNRCGRDKCDRHKWQYDVELPTGLAGQRQRATKGGFATARDAIEARAEVLRKYKEGTYSLDPKMTLAQWLPKWLDARIERGELRDGTITDYRDSIHRFLIPRLGHLKLAELRAAQITAAYDAMRRDRAAEIATAEEINVTRRAEAAAKNAVEHPGRPRVPHLVKVPKPLGPLTMRRIHNVLSGALKSAVRAGLMSRNPAADAELPKLVVPRAKIWTAYQLGGFLDAIEDQRLYPLYHLAAFAGMRRGELCGISWDDVDLDAGRITVRWQITEQGYRKGKAAEKQGRHGEYRSKPKTRAGEDRVVDLDSVSTAVLRAWRREQAKEREAWGSEYADPTDVDGTPYHLVFTRENGEPLDPGQTYATFVRLVRGAGLTHVKLHGLRHLNISLQLEAGVSETIIAMRVGHTSPALIRSTYGHLIGTIGQRAAEATAALVPRQAKAARKQEDEPATATARSRTQAAKRGRIEHRRRAARTLRRVS
jgi:integrase